MLKIEKKRKKLQKLIQIKKNTKISYYKFKKYHIKNIQTLIKKKLSKKKSKKIYLIIIMIPHNHSIINSINHNIPNNVKIPIINIFPFKPNIRNINRIM